MIINLSSLWLTGSDLIIYQLSKHKIIIKLIQKGANKNDVDCKNRTIYDLAEIKGSLDTLSIIKDNTLFNNLFNSTPPAAILKRTNKFIYIFIIITFFLNFYFSLLIHPHYSYSNDLSNSSKGKYNYILLITHNSLFIIVILSYISLTLSSSEVSSKTSKKTDHELLQILLNKFEIDKKSNNSKLSITSIIEDTKEYLL